MNTYRYYDIVITIIGRVVSQCLVLLLAVEYTTAAAAMPPTRHHQRTRAAAVAVSSWSSEDLRCRLRWPARSTSVRVPPTPSRYKYIPQRYTHLKLNKHVL